MAQLRHLQIEPRHWLYPSNLLSLLRFILVIPGYLFLVRQQYPQALILLILIAASDMLDGVLARRLGQVSELGKLLDPLADKCAIMAGLAALVFSGRIPWWILIPILVRDVAIISGSALLIRQQASVPMANIWGKLATNSVALVIFTQLFPVAESIRWLALSLMLLLILLSSVVYLQRFLHAWRSAKR